MFGSTAVVILIALVAALAYLRLDQPQSLEELNEQLSEGALQTIREWMGREGKPSSGRDVRDDGEKGVVVGDTLATDDASDVEPSPPERGSLRDDASSDEISEGAASSEDRDRDGMTPYTGEELGVDETSQDGSIDEASPRRGPDSSVSREVDGAESPSSSEEETSSSPRVSEHDPEATATREKAGEGLCGASSAARGPDSVIQDGEDERLSEASTLGEESADGDDDAGDTDGFGIIQPASGDDDSEAMASSSDEERSGAEQAGIIGLERGQSRPPSSGSDGDSEE